MHQDKRHILWAPEDHPSPELLQQYQEETLPPALSHQLERHVLDCALCSDVLEGLAVSATSTIPAAEKDLNQRIAATFRSKKQKSLPVYLGDWRVAAAIVLVLCTTVLVFYYNYQELTRPTPGIASETDKAIEYAMDLSEKTGPSEPRKIADAVPDTIRPAIAAAPAPAALRRRAAPAPPAPPQEFLVDTPEQASDPFELTEAIPDAPLIARSAERAESFNAPAYNIKNTFVPESTDVSKALQGQVAGVAKRKAASTATVGPRQVRGQVISTDGQPLPGVAVVVKGTTTGVATDAAGNFILELPSDAATLAFRFIGYQTKEQAVNASTDNLIVDMQVDTRALSEVVVTGYGSSKVSSPVIVAAKPGIGTSAYRKYLEENIRYSADSKRGRVVVKATVMPSGALQNLQVVRSLCPSCDEEALRLVRQGPTWKPATQDGAGIEKDVRIIVRFKPDQEK